MATFLEHRSRTRSQTTVSVAGRIILMIGFCFNDLNPDNTNGRLALQQAAQ